MPRLIDADAARAVIATVAEKGSPCAEMAEAMIKWFDAQPTVGGWISAQDILPEREGLYLCWSAINGGEACYQIHLWKDGRWYWVHDVRYWMPLPEMPEENSNEI